MRQTLRYVKSNHCLISLNLHLLQTATALMYDAVHLFATALDQLDQSQVCLQVITNEMSCTNYGTGDHYHASQLLGRRYVGSWELSY